MPSDLTVEQILIKIRKYWISENCKKVGIEKLKSFLENMVF